jgi:hypothetical protein
MPMRAEDNRAVETQMGTVTSLPKLISAFPSLSRRGLLRQVIGISEKTLEIRVAKDPCANFTLEQS